MSTIDYEHLRNTVRAVLLASEIVIIDATGEYVGIRDGEFNAGTMTRPDAPDERPIMTSTLVAWEQWDLFSTDGKDLWFQEFFLPASDFYEASTTQKFSGILQYNVWALKGSNQGQRTETANEITGRYAKYIADVMDKNKDGGVLADTQDGVEGIVLESVSRGPGISDSTKWPKYYGIPVSINLTVYKTQAAS